MRKRSGWIIVQCKNFAAQFFQPTRHKNGAGSVATVNSDRQSSRSNYLNVESALECVDMVFNRIRLGHRCLYLIPRGLHELILMKDIQQFLTLDRIQLQSVGTNEFQRVPLLRIV